MKQVLIVDEDPFVAGLIVKRLEGECTVHRSHDAEAALEVIRHGGRFDLILCRRNLGAPKGGQKLWERMKKECPEQAAKLVLFNALPVSAPPPGPRLYS